MGGGGGSDRPQLAPDLWVGSRVGSTYPLEQPTVTASEQEKSGGGDDLDRVRSENGDIVEDRKSRPRWAIAIEEIEQHETVVGDEHRLGGPTLAAQRELDHVACTHFATRLDHFTPSTSVCTRTSTETYPPAIPPMAGIPR